MVLEYPKRKNRLKNIPNWKHDNMQKIENLSAK